MREELPSATIMRLVSIEGRSEDTKVVGILEYDRRVVPVSEPSESCRWLSVLARHTGPLP